MTIVFGQRYIDVVCRLRADDGETEMAVSSKGGNRRRAKTQIYIDAATLASPETIRSLIVGWVAPRLAAEFAALESSASHKRAEAEEEAKIAA